MEEKKYPKNTSKMILKMLKIRFQMFNICLSLKSSQLFT